MILVNQSITIAQLKEISNKIFGGLVKAVVDIRQKKMVVDAAMHADEESYLLKLGSNQDDLWGINLYPELENDDFIEFDSMINIRPKLHNLTRSVEDPKVRDQIKLIVNQLVVR